MRIYFRYAFRETFSNLWRNRLMTLAAVLTVAVSLALVGAALVIKQSASQVSAIWEQETSVTVWMKPHASIAEANAVSSQLATLPYVHGPCKFRTKAQNYAQAKTLLTASEFANLTVDDVGVSFLCTPQIPSDASVVINTFKSQAGVYAVTAPIAEIKQQEKAIHVAQWIFVALAGTLFVSAVVLILNTIQLAIFARRREVTVMKLVGATNWFIRIPYITEGFIQGFLGSLIAVLLIVALHTWIPVSHQWQLSTQDIVGTSAVVMVLGVLIGSLGSAFAIRRFLDV